MRPYALNHHAHNYRFRLSTYDLAQLHEGVQILVTANRVLIHQDNDILQYARR